MKSNVLLKSILIVVLLKLLGTPNVTFAQQVATYKAKSLKGNVVRIEATFPNDKIDGFGFIIGAKDSFYIVTALHNLQGKDGEGIDVQPTDIRVYFENETSVSGVYKYDWNGLADLAMLSAPIVNKQLNWNRYSVMSQDMQKNFAVTYLGTNKKWTSPLIEGKVDSISQTRHEIYFLIDDLLGGTSGAPLIGSNGIAGMILSTDTQKSQKNGTAIPISRIKTLINESKPGYYMLEFDVNGMRSIPGGAFIMGDKNGADNARYEHEVKVKPFYVMPYEISFEEYYKYCNSKQKKKPKDQGWGSGNKPVINVSWFDAIDYCNWRSDQELLKPVYEIGENGIVKLDTNKNGYRLPTEAEWEYLAKTGSIEEGEAIYQTPKDVNFKTKAKRQSPTWAVSEGSENNFGVFNLRGNVAEWCWDNYDHDFYKTSESKNPIGPLSGRAKVVRGGSWNSDKFGVQLHARDSKLPNFGYPTVGFRLVRNAE